MRLLLLMPPARVSKIRKFVCCAGGGDCGDRRARTSFCAAILLAGPSPPTPPPPPLLLLLLLLLLLFSLSCARSSSFLRPLPCSGIDVVRDSVQRPVVFFPCLFIATQPMHFEMNLPFSRPREELVRFFLWQTQSDYCTVFVFLSFFLFLRSRFCFFPVCPFVFFIFLRSLFFFVFLLFFLIFVLVFPYSLFFFCFFSMPSRLCSKSSDLLPATAALQRPLAATTSRSWRRKEKACKFPYPPPRSLTGVSNVC